MPFRRTDRLVVLLVVLLDVGLLSGCAGSLHEQKLIQPEGPSSQACLARCDRLKDECEARQNLREQECAARVTAAKADYEVCVASGSTPCSQPESCLGADMTICQRHYEECFTGCGGRVERQLRSHPWASPPRSQPAAPPKEPAG